MLNKTLIATTHNDNRIVTISHGEMSSFLEIVTVRCDIVASKPKARYPIKSVEASLVYLKLDRS